MKTRIYFIILLLISLFTLTGCTNLNGIDQFYFIVSIGIDETPEGNLNLSIQASSTSSSSDSRRQWFFPIK